MTGTSRSEESSRLGDLLHWFITNDPEDVDPDAYRWLRDLLESESRLYPLADEMEISRRVASDLTDAEVRRALELVLPLAIAQELINIEIEREKGEQ